ncbi:MAG TPA: hypothetical protein VMU07_02855 [Candidatus Paceibacterota bacterium]|nr:hypothetical protein [Candidatus Paceibacterota bacterium]
MKLIDKNEAYREHDRLKERNEVVLLQLQELAPEDTLNLMSSFSVSEVCAILDGMYERPRERATAKLIYGFIKFRSIHPEKFPKEKEVVDFATEMEFPFTRIE